MTQRYGPAVVWMDADSFEWAVWEEADTTTGTVWHHRVDSVYRTQALPDGSVRTWFTTLAADETSSGMSCIMLHTVDRDEQGRIRHSRNTQRITSGMHCYPEVEVLPIGRNHYAFFVLKSCSQWGWLQATWEVYEPDGDALRLLLEKFAEESNAVAQSGLVLLK